MIGVGGHDEPALAQAKQVVLAQQPLHLLAVYTPAAIVQLPRDAAAAVIAELQSDALDLVAQLHVWVCRRGLGLPAIEARTPDLGQSAELTGRDGDGQANLLFEVRVDEPRVVNACSVRCSSTCCKHPRKKSILPPAGPPFVPAQRFDFHQRDSGPVR